MVAFLAGVIQVTWSISISALVLLDRQWMSLVIALTLLFVLLASSTTLTQSVVSSLKTMLALQLVLVGIHLLLLASVTLALFLLLLVAFLVA